MTKTVDFYFDFSSPYGYLASTRIESIAQAHGREVNWKPILLGFIFKVTEGKPLVSFPLKGEYSVLDMKRTARELDIPFSMPGKFPLGAVAASRAVLWSQKHHADSATPLIHELYKNYFVDDLDISDVATVLKAASNCGLDPDELSAALEDSAIKAMLKSAVDEAIAGGVFGSPFIVIDGEPFWGHDRLPQVERWLASGGW